MNRLTTVNGQRSAGGRQHWLGITMYHVCLTLIICFVASGCAWGYAGQEGRNRQRDPDAKNVKVVEVEEDKKTDTTESDLPAEPVEPEGSPCGVDTFEVEQFAADGLMRKTIDCRTRQTIDVQRVPLSDNAYQRMKSNGYPAGKWYIVVEPRSVADGVLNNDHLLQMSREFDIDYYGRDSDTGRLIYLFISPVA